MLNFLQLGEGRFFWIESSCSKGSGTGIFEVRDVFGFWCGCVKWEFCAEYFFQMAIYVGVAVCNVCTLSGWQCSCSERGGLFVDLKLSKRCKEGFGVESLFLLSEWWSVSDESSKIWYMAVVIILASHHLAGNWTWASWPESQATQKGAIAYFVFYLKLRGIFAWLAEESLFPLHKAKRFIRPRCRRHDLIGSFRISPEIDVQLGKRHSGMIFKLIILIAFRIVSTGGSQYLTAEVRFNCF
jgi:hypothetical protein